MGAGFTIHHKNTGVLRKPEMILVSNYEADNEVVHWLEGQRECRTRSDIGIWKIRYKPC